MSPVFAALIALLACADGDDAATEVAPPEDADDDGWPLGLDCDDDNAAIFPGAAEHCGGGDEDCDGVEDDHASDGTLLWRDADGDGWGDADAADRVCVPGAGWAAQSGDCDDGDPLVYPFATESCATAADDDCDNSTNDADAVGCRPFYEDTDGDGFGTLRTHCLCEAEGNYRAEVGGDCDDHDAGVVDGCALGGAMPVESADALLVGAEPVDLAGIDLDYPGDLDGDGVGDLVVSAPGHREGAAYVLRGPIVADRDLRSPEARILLPDTRDTWDVRARGGLDADGDGDPDVLVAAHYEDPDRDARVDMWLADGGVTGDLDLTGAPFAGSADGDADGGPIAFDAGDANGDGVADVIVGRPWIGRANVALGPFDRTDLEAGIYLRDTTDCLGTAAVFAGDLDGDGLDDVAVGLPCSDETDDESGEAWIVAGGTTTSVTSDGAATATLAGPAAGAALGSALCAAGDLDGDGRADLVAVAAGDGYARGAAWLFPGPIEGALGTADATAEIDGDVFASLSTCAAAGDADADGYGDLLFGGPDDDGGATDAGIAAYVRGPLAGTLALSEADAVFTSASPGARAGAGLAGGDLDADGFADVVIGAPGLDVGAESAGGAWVFLGAQR